MLEANISNSARKLPLLTMKYRGKAYSFLRSNSGVSNVEYAVMLAICIGAICTGAGLLGVAVNKSVDKLAMSDTDVSTHSDAPPTETTPNVFESTSKYFSANRHWLQLFGAQVVTFVALGIVLYVLRRERKRKEAEGDAGEITGRILGTVVQNQLYKKRQKIYQLLSNDMRAVIASQMDVRHVMSDRLKIVSPTTPVEEIRSTMQSKQFHHLVVCDQAGKLVGIISDRDISSRTGETAEDIMTKRPLTVKKETLIIPTVTMMIERRISCLPVVSASGELEGLLTSTDLLMALQCALQILHKLAGELDCQDSNSDLNHSEDKPKSDDTESAGNAMPINSDSAPDSYATNSGNLLWKD